MYKKLRLLLIAGLFTSSNLLAQSDNSPYSRYGIGDLLNTQNAINRGMGGVSAAYYDYTNLNLINPAANSKLTSTAFNFGVEISNRTIRSGTPPEKYSNYSPNISYLQLGLPLAKKQGWNLFLGLKPLSRISYKIAQGERLNFGSSTDSVNNMYEGSGGLYIANIGTAITVFKNFSVGINAEYHFGSKDYSTRRTFLNDTVNYYRSNHQTQSSMNGMVFTGGFQYAIPMGKKSILQLGAYGRTTTDLKATRQNIRETFTFNGNTGANVTIDSVFTSDEESGKLTLPANYGIGFIFNRINKWQFGVDYVSTKWSEYRFFNQKDLVNDSWQVKTGFQILPKGGENYWSNVYYRAGVNFGKDYVSINEDLNTWAVTAGLSFPMRKSPYSNQFSVIQTTFEYGKRGDKNSILRENYFQLTVGLSLNDIWFIKRKYD